jgi:hypothetical protein
MFPLKTIVFISLFQKHAEFPLTTISAIDDTVGEHCENLFIDINRSWEPLMTAALGYPQ